MIKIRSPIIDNDDLAKLRNIERSGFQTITLPMTFNVNRRRRRPPRRAGRSYAPKPTRRSKYGATILILSDRSVDKDIAPIPSLLATSGLITISCAPARGQRRR